MTFLLPWGLIGLIAIPLILLFYILKQKRERHTVSSLVLWQQVVRDMQARTPWQKLRKNLLMFLQILAALCIVMALAGLAVKLVKGNRESVIIVLDTSLSMSSTDTRPTRLDAAKGDALQYIDELQGESRITVVTLGREADVLLYASTSREEARQSIQSIEGTQEYMDPAKAEELLLSLKKQDPSASVVLFGDKPVRVGNEAIQFSNYESQKTNLAVIRFTHVRTKERITAMSIIRNQGDADIEASVSLYANDVFLDSQRTEVPANGTQTIWWQDIPSDSQTLHCVIDTGDILETDNHAYDTIQSGDLVKVLLVTEGNYFLEKVFSLIEGVELVRTLPEEITEYKGYDLYVLDGTVPQNLPGDGNIVIFAPQPNSLFPVGDWMDTPQVHPTKHAIFRYLDTLSFSIGRTRIIDKPEWAEIIAEDNGNPVIMEGRIKNTRILVFGFNLYETDLPLRTEFPVLISNILTEYASNNTYAISGVLTGDAVQFRLLPDTQSAAVILPDGKAVAVAPPIPPEPFLQTQTAGLYRLQQKKESGIVDNPFSVNISDEWMMERTGTGITEEDIEAGMSIPLEKSDFPLTLPLLAAAILILLLEWWYYANRNYI